VPARSATQPATPEPLAIAAAQTVPPVVPATATSRTSIVLGLSGASALGVLPGLGVFGQLSVLVDPASLPALRISIAKWAADQEVVAAGGVRFSAVSSGASVCPGLRAYRGIKPSLCFGGDVARLTATGFDFDSNDRQIEWLVHLTGDVGMTIPIGGRWSASVSIGSWVALDRPRFVYMDGTSTRAIFSPSIVAGVGRIGLGVRL